MPYNKSAALGAKLKKNDYRSIDIGIAAAYITAEAEALGLSSCILGWLDAKKIKKMCDLEGDPRLVIAIGYAKDDKMREKKRKPLSELVSEKEIF
jgi:nitroreductase